MAYSWGMADLWLELVDGQETRRVPLVGSLTRIGGAAPDVSMPGLPAGELHFWSDPPKIVLVAGDPLLAVNGGSCREGLMADGDRIDGGDVRFIFRCELNEPVLKEIPVLAPAPVQAEPTESGGGAAWSRVRAGMFVELGLADKAGVRKWQESVMRGEFSPDACARDLSQGVDVAGEDPRVIERASRLLRDFLMSSATSGFGGAKRKVRQAGKKGMALIISQLLVIGFYTLIILVAMLAFRANGTNFDDLLDELLPDKGTSTRGG